MNCKYCGAEVEQVQGKRQKEYCHDAHRQAYWRQQHLNGANSAEIEAQIAYRDKRIEEQAQQIAQLEAKNLDLQKTIEQERKDRNSYQEQASEVALTWMHENSRLKTELERTEHHYKLARQFQDETQPTEQIQELAELRKENAQLRKKLEDEKNYLRDTKARYFQSWLKKQPSSPWRVRFLSDQLVPARGTHAHYLAHMKRLQMTEEEHEDFTRLWKLFVLER